jgi:hypothetical protein
MPKGGFKDPHPPIENEALRLAIEAMSTDRLAEMVGWPKDIIGRYRKQDLLRYLRVQFVGYLNGYSSEGPPRGLESIHEALGAFFAFWTSKLGGWDSEMVRLSNNAFHLIQDFEIE